ncbi:MAG: histidine phosphotransferase family protein [Alphaproteobacteria bacterium]|nr:histidine phosphotransferase family protein [Alphaproteobacteria bacterium]
MQIDLRVLELLSSKLCHDLISPVSAINNGVELIEDIGGSVVEEAMKLIGNSAVQSSRRLRVFRLAYGRAGSEANLPLRDMRQIAQQYFTEGKIKLEWAEDLDLPGVAEQRGLLKTLINMLIMAEEVLAYGGDISLHRLGDDDKIGCRLEIAGRNAHLSQQFEDALTAATLVEDLTPRTIQPYITGRFAEHFGIQISHRSPKDDMLEIILCAAVLEYDQHQVE